MRYKFTCICGHAFVIDGTPRVISCLKCGRAYLYKRGSKRYIYIGRWLS